MHYLFLTKTEKGESMPIITWSCERQGGSHSLHSSALPPTVPVLKKQKKNISHYSALGHYLASSFNLTACFFLMPLQLPKTRTGVKRLLSHFLGPNIISAVIIAACCRGPVFLCSLLLWVFLREPTVYFSR